MKLSSSTVLSMVTLAPSVFGGIMDKSKPTQLFQKIGKRLEALQNSNHSRNLEENADDCCCCDCNGNGNDDGINDDSSSNSPTTSPTTTNQPTTQSEGIKNAMFNIYTALGTTTVDLTAATYCSWNGVTCDSDNIEPTSIVLSDKGLTGYLATDIGMITELTVLDVGYNQLTGTLPVELSKNTLLSELNIGTNLISGPVPEAFNELDSLTILDLSENMLTGTISPLELPPDLTFLSLSGNEFTGPIPDVSGLSVLSHFLMNDNAFSSTIPDASEFPSSLAYLVLGENDLTGDIPDLSSLPLEELDISYNMFDGQALPTWPFGADRLSKGINLSGNQFTGQIPYSVYTSMSEVIDISDNQLTGGFYTMLGYLTSLKVFDVSDNDLTYTMGFVMDFSFNNMVAIERVHFDNNNFDGTTTAFCDDDIEFTYSGTSITHDCS